jgi:hypothetical protein
MRPTQKIDELTSLLRRPRKLSLSYYLVGVWMTSLLGCTLTATRPIQEMSYTSAALRSAKEVQADNLAPELYRQATEWLFKAKQEYQLRYFKLARESADKARWFAEQAEFEAISNGGVREDANIKDPMDDKVGSAAYPYPTPQSVPAEEYESRKGGSK